MPVKNKPAPVVSAAICAACGECAESCPRRAIIIQNGMRAHINQSLCAKCGMCAAVCPASAIRMEEA